MQNLKELGNRFKILREKNNLNISNLAKKIGVDRTYLSKVENGHERPSIEIFNRLISHYSLSEVEIRELWTLSGYTHGFVVTNTRGKEVTHMEDKQLPQNSVPDMKQVEIKVPDDKVILYSDAVYITTTQFGLVFDFAQNMGPTNKQTVVSRIGMSKEHGKALLRALSDRLNEDSKGNLDKKKGKNIN